MDNTFTGKIELLDHWLYVSVPTKLSTPLKCLATNFGFIAINESGQIELANIVDADGRRNAFHCTARKGA